MSPIKGKAQFLPVGNGVISWPEISQREEAKAENPAAGKPTAGLGGRFR
jgi:hypothetical protein